MNTTAAMSLKRLQDRFREALPERMASLRDQFEGISLENWQREDLELLHGMVHRLTGAAGTFGMTSLSKAARALEIRLLKALRLGEAPTPEAWESLLIAGLDLQTLAEMCLKIESTPPVATSRDCQGQGRPLVFLLDDEKDQLAYLEQVLESEGYRVRGFFSSSAFCEALNDGGERPSAIVMDMVLEEGGLQGARLIGELGLGGTDGIPVVMISVRDDLEARLAAFRAGACRYFVKPAEVDAIVGLMDSLTGRQPDLPYRVLLVDDDPFLLETQALVLQEAGMEVRSLGDPLDVLEVMDAWLPEVVVLDVHMPDVTGPEVAAILRERDDYLDLPILFLSAETDVQRQLQAMKLGGDEFLIKPVKPSHLIEVVVARARRSRQNVAIRKRLQVSLYEREREHLAVAEHAIVSVTDKFGLIIDVNERFCSVSGYQRDELLGHNHRLVKSEVHPDSFYRDMWSTIAQGEVWQGEVCNRRKDGSHYWVESTITPFLDARGKPYQYVSIRTDITHVKNAELALKERERELVATLEATRDGILVVDAERRVSFANERFKQMWRLSDRALFKGARDVDIMRRIRSQAADSNVFLKQVENIYRSLEASFDMLEMDDGRIYERYSQPVTLVRGTGRVWSFHDISGHKRAEAEAEFHKERLRRGQIFANIGTWEWNLKSGELYWTERIAPLFGYLDGELKTTYENYMAAVHPDDRQAVREAIAASLTKDVPYDIEHRVLWPDGSVHWLLERGAVLRDEDGEAVQMIGVVQDITEQVSSKQAMIKAREEADRANQAKSEFLSSMSHELRTPLNAIIGFGQLLEYEEAMTEDQKDSVQEILKAGRHLLTLINEVLDLAKVESGHLQLSLESVKATTVVDECLALVTVQAVRRGIRLYKKGLDDVVLRADRFRLKQVLLNLLSNAIKYNHDAGAVTIDACPGNDECRIRLRVTDTGQGIPAYRHAELFQPFNRLDAEHSSIEGTGIGLTITRRITELMGGEVGILSEVGVGSTFWIELPSVTLPDQEGGEDKDETAWGGAMSPWEKHPMLYIEDNPSNIKLVANLLGRYPHIQLFTAHTPELGIELAMAKQPALILLDINMPGMDGYETLSVLRSEKSTRHIPVVALTANGMPRDIERGKQAGFDDYLTKPLDVAIFLRVINGYLAIS